MKELEWLKQNDFRPSKGHPVHSFQKFTTQAMLSLKGTTLSQEEYEWLVEDIKDLWDAISLQQKPWNSW